MPGREKIYIEYMGCPQRSLDARRLADYFVRNGIVISKTPRNTDYILFISCACRKIDENFAIRRIKELSQYQAELILGGCLKAIHRGRIEEFFKGPVLGTSDIEKIDQLFPHFHTSFAEIPDTNRLYPRNKFQLLKLYPHSLQLGFNLIKPVLDYLERKNFKKYWYVRVGRGCVKEHCTYCSVWKAVGALRSKPLDRCVREFNEGLKLGYKNILITADNLGAYGLDIDSTLPDLLENITKLKGEYSVQLENLHPFWIIKYFQKLLPLLSLQKIKLILCAVQSGNDRILGLMNRRHSRAQIKEALLKIKEMNPAVKLHTQIIVGFPSETETEFEETLSLIREVGFSLVYISTYSHRSDSHNAHLTDQQVPGDIIGRRVKKAVKFFKRNKIVYFVYSVK